MDKTPKHYFEMLDIIKDPERRAIVASKLATVSDTADRLRQTHKELGAIALGAAYLRRDLYKLIQHAQKDIGRITNNSIKTEINLELNHMVKLILKNDLENQAEIEI